MNVPTYGLPHHLPAFIVPGSVPPEMPLGEPEAAPEAGQRSTEAAPNDERYHHPTIIVPPHSLFLMRVLKLA